MISQSSLHIEADVSRIAVLTTNYMVTHWTSECKMFMIDILQKGGRSMWVYARYIVKNGIRIYPKRARVFRFWVDDVKTN